MRARFLPILIAAALPFLAGFTHFTETNNVCPSCKIPSRDVVVLKGGERLPCEVIAENQDYYILLWHAEYRAADKSEVGSIEWDGGKVRSVTSSDQVRDTSGFVYNGKLSEHNERFLTISDGPLTHTIWLPFVKDAHQGGQRLHLAR